MTDRDEFRAGFAKRLRELRLSLGYKTAANFARAIGYRPDTICRYEREGFEQAGPLIQFVKALENAGLAEISLDWLCDTAAKGCMWRRPPAKRAIRVEGNVIHGAFGR